VKSVLITSEWTKTFRIIQRRISEPVLNTSAWSFVPFERDIKTKVGSLVLSYAFLSGLDAMRWKRTSPATKHILWFW